MMAAARARYVIENSLGATSLILYQELDKWQLAKRVTKYPSLLEFLGYSYVNIVQEAWNAR